LHLDLIAGLPFEDLNSFEKTFDDVFALRPKELQLGFLKLLRGTKMRREAEQYAYEYMDKPPYEFQKNHVLSVHDVEEIHLAEEALELYWNKNFLPETMTLLLEEISSPFRLFRQIGHFFLQKGYFFHRYEFSDPFEWLADFVSVHRPDSYSPLFDSLKREYLLASKMKPKIWWDNEEEKQWKNAIIRDFYSTNKSVPIEDLYKHAVVTPYHGKHLIVIYGTIPPQSFLH